jgi:ABC-2 type transport system permease protein
LSDNPTSSIAFWLSIIPFTAPVAMMVRIPFGVASWEILLSCSLMIAFIVICVVIAAKIYRTGILMYGKKITYKELWKWLKYKN